jgi:uncharacterized flavoprotein (TIGR03862 family)
MKKTIAIIGGGASALVLAAMLDENIYDVTIYERNAALGRKFLVAGDGGFNLTHSEDLENLISRYTFDHFGTHSLEHSLRHFTNLDTRDWFKYIGIETYIGTSKRIFPIHGIKPIHVLNAVLNVLKNKNVCIKTKHIWQGFNPQNDLVFLQNDVKVIVKSDFTVFSLGGASWSKTGSDGHWTSFFEEKGIGIIPFQASNCGYKIDWESNFLKQSEGQFLKNIALSCGEISKRGEVVVTQFGLEGGAIYALSPAIRAQLKEAGTATVYIDLKPILSLSDIKQKLASKGNKSTTSLLKEQLNLSETAIALLKSQLTKADFMDRDILMSKIKKLPLSIKGISPIEEAISTVGGISLDELDADFQFKKLPNHYAIGEMLDWDAPTGGYLLQACFSMGSYLANHLNQISLLFLPLRPKSDNF